MNMMKLAKLVVAAALALTFVVSCGFSSHGTGVSYHSVNGYSGYNASSDPVLLLLSLFIIGLYAWVLRLPMEESRGFVTAGIWLRFWAAAVDFLFATLMLMPWLGLIALLVEAGHTGHFAWTVQRQPAQDGDGLLSFMLVLPGMLSLLVYFALPLYLKRATPGSILCGIAVRYDTGKRPSFISSLGRTALGYVALCGCFISIPMALSNSEKRMWQDKAFGTRVVQWSD